MYSSLRSIYCLGDTRGFGAGGEGTGSVLDDLNMRRLQEYSPCPVLLCVCAACLSFPVPPPQAPLERSLCLFL